MQIALEGARRFTMKKNHKKKGSRILIGALVFVLFVGDKYLMMMNSPKTPIVLGLIK